ncbi:MAG: MaoC family dehydratase N-terminal domain-containing protein [Acidimicrobiales bacterium]
MNLSLLGQVVVDTELVVEEARIEQLARAIGTATGRDSALRAPFFGPTAAGQDSVVGPLQMDLSRALQGGQSYEWHRSFRVGERVRLTVTIEDILDKTTLHLATVLAEFRDQDGALIQRQRTSFIERALPAAAQS